MIKKIILLASILGLAISHDVEISINVNGEHLEDVYFASPEKI